MDRIEERNMIRIEERDMDRIEERDMVRENLFSWEHIVDGTGTPKGIRITAVDPKEEYVKIPEELDGLPVLELGAYALEKSAIREIQLPSCLERIGRYAFYNCEKLEKIQLSEGLKDIGSGAFTGVHKVHSIHLTMKEEGAKQVVLQELLSDFSETIQVTLVLPGGQDVSESEQRIVGERRVFESEQRTISEKKTREIRLLFPEYYEQGVENTPARIIVNQFFGTGMKYRNCFLNRQLQYEEYDKLFPLAVAGERIELVRELALLRLMWPYRLKDNYRQKYLEWISERAEEIFEFLIEEKRLEEIRFILEEADLTEEVKKEAALRCSESGFAAAVPLFMEQQMAEELPVVFSSFNLDEI